MPEPVTLTTVGLAVPKIVTPEGVSPVTDLLKVAVKLMMVDALGPVTGSACPMACSTVTVGGVLSIV